MPSHADGTEIAFMPLVAMKSHCSLCRYMTAAPFMSPWRGTIFSLWGPVEKLKTLEKLIHNKLSSYNSSPPCYFRWMTFKSPRLPGPNLSQPTELFQKLCSSDWQWVTELKHGQTLQKEKFFGTRNGPTATFKCCVRVSREQERLITPPS